MTFVPGYVALGDEDPDDPPEPFNPAGPVFGPWLNAILGKGAATHWITLSEPFTAMQEHHGAGFALDTETLAIDAADDLGAGWRAVVLGPGIIDPAVGDDIELGAGEWAQVGSDGTTVHILRAGRLPDTWVPVEVVANEAVINLSLGDRFLLVVDDDCEIQVPVTGRPIPFALRILIDGGPFTVTLAEGWLGEPPTILSGDGDETVCSGIVLDPGPPATAVLGTVKQIPAA